MRTLLTSSFLLLSLGAFGCGDDGGGGGGTPDANDPNAPDAAPPVALTGTMTDEDDTALPNIKVEVYGATPANSTTTDANGDWTLMVSPGERTFLLSGTGFWGSINRLTISAAGMTGIDFNPVAARFRSAYGRPRLSGRRHGATSGASAPDSG